MPNLHNDKPIEGTRAISGRERRRGTGAVAIRAIQATGRAPIRLATDVMKPMALREAEITVARSTARAGLEHTLTRLAKEFLEF